MIDNAKIKTMYDSIFKRINDKIEAMTIKNVAGINKLVYLSATFEKVNGDLRTFNATQVAKNKVKIKSAATNSKPINVPKPIGFFVLIPTKLPNSEKLELTIVFS